MVDFGKRPIRKAFRYWVALYLCGLLISWTAPSFVVAAYAAGGPIETSSPSFEGAITIVLSALSIMITVLAIIIAIVGTIGFNNLRKAAFEAGMKHAAEQMGDGGAIRELLIARVDELYSRETFKPVPQGEWGNPEGEYGE